ncbi:MAG: hypothetical protein HZT40_04985 [Candidatus Thiothrix singaporensis]|uniref:Uncharacterized protein n=1 Tax=Candidatus Thiothrix singaporensis TaxID=2799669 RepID=A0A7L6APM6_9GAMM|nr:MAG: hypothetical protein HZT40_04985 [Candidatus Thiothrix singaporensis]
MVVAAAGGSGGVGHALAKFPAAGDWERIVDKHLMPFVLSGKAGRLGWLPLAVLSLALLAAVLAMAGCLGKA